MKYKTMSDMGSIKIFNKTMSCFFSNGFGDGENTVEVLKGRAKKDCQFLEHFTVKTKAYLSSYDCSDEAIHTFGKGRWFVYLKKEGHFIIEKIDDETHS